MSILAAGDPDSPLSQIIPIALACAALAGAGYLGAFRAGSVSRPLRVSPGRDARGVLLVIFVGAGAWILTQILYASVRQMMLVRTNGAAARFDEKMFTPGDWAFLATIPAVVGFFALFAGDLAVEGRHLLARLGLRRRLLDGLGTGLIGIVLALPLVIVVSTMTEQVYRALHIVHPTEHDLLREMGTIPSRWIKAALIFGAVGGAPFFEEFFFRAHVQTYLRGFLVLLSSRRPVATAPISVSAPGSMPLEYQTVPIPVKIAPRSVVWQTWLAIVLTSMLFSVVHPAWTWPPICALAVCLGFAYERTGNLWTCITMHALFNAFETVVYLNSPHG